MASRTVGATHAIARYGLPLDWHFWERHDRRFLEICDEVVVLMLDGWQQSVGVKAEIAIARSLGKAVTYLAVGEEAQDAPMSRQVM